MVERPAPVTDIPLYLLVTDPALIFPVPLVPSIEMTKETDVDRHPHMLSLHYIGVAAPAVKAYAPGLP